MMQPRMGGIIQANIPDVETLYLSYMPYVVGGGSFVLPRYGTGAKYGLSVSK